MSTADTANPAVPSPAKKPRKGYQASKGLYFKHVELPRGTGGKRRRRTFYGKTLAEVDRNIADAKVRGGGSIAPTSPTRLSEYGELWLERAGLPVPAGRGLKPTTVETYTWVWEQVAPIIGSTRLDRCDKEMARFLIAELQRRPRTRVVRGKTQERTATANTIRHVTRVMHTLFKDATDDGVFQGINPFAQLGRRAKPKHKAKKGRALTLAEARAFLDAAREDRYEAAWLLELFASLRIGEAFGLRWSDIDFAARTIDVQQQIVMVKNKPLVQSVKTPDSERLRPIADLVYEAMLRRRAAAEKEKHGSDLVFPSLNGTMMSTKNARRRNFAAIVKSAGISGRFTPHHLRHTFSSLHHLIGTPERVTSAGMGHADSKITRLTYTHALDGEHRVATDNLDRLVRTGTTSRRRVRVSAAGLNVVRRK